MRFLLNGKTAKEEHDEQGQGRTRGIGVMELPKNCGNCDHFDGDAHCALLPGQRVITGFIVLPSKAVCVKHEPKDAER